MTITSINESTPMIALDVPEQTVVKAGTYPYYLSDFRRDHRNVSIGSFIYTTEMERFGFAPVVVDPKPQGDVIEVGAVVLVDGEYHQKWNVRSFTEQELEDRFAAERTLRLADLDALERDVRLKSRPFDAFDAEGNLVTVITNYQGSTINNWLIKRAVAEILVSEGEVNPTVSIFSDDSREVVLPADQCMVMAATVFKEANATIEKIDRHRLQLLTATRAEGLPSYPSWIN